MVRLTLLINWFTVLLAFLEYALFGTLWFAVFFKNNSSLKKGNKNL
jgi:hypothetical protein